MKEVWISTSLLGYEGYEVSHTGRIRSYWKMGPRSGLMDEPRVLNPPITKDGYRLVELKNNKRRKAEYLHRLVAMLFMGPCPDGMEVRHLNGIKLDNRVVNLSYDTRSINMLDSVKHGSTPSGSAHPFAKLNETKVKKIRSRYLEGGITQKALAEEHGVDQSIISRAINARNWKQV